MNMKLKLNISYSYSSTISMLSVFFLRGSAISKIINLKAVFVERFLLSLRGQTVHFVHCKRIPQQGRSLFFFCSLIFFDRSDKILTCLKTWLWNPGTYRHKIVLLSTAQFDLVVLRKSESGRILTDVLTHVSLHVLLTLQQKQTILIST